MSVHVIFCHVNITSRLSSFSTLKHRHWSLRQSWTQWRCQLDWFCQCGQSCGGGGGAMGCSCQSEERLNFAEIQGKSWVKKTWKNHWRKMRQQKSNRCQLMLGEFWMNLKWFFKTGDPWVLTMTWTGVSTCARSPHRVGGLCIDTVEACWVHQSPCSFRKGMMLY